MRLLQRLSRNKFCSIGGSTNIFQTYCKVILYLKYFNQIDKKEKNDIAINLKHTPWWKLSHEVQTSESRSIDTYIQYPRSTPTQKIFVITFHYKFLKRTHRYVTNGVAIARIRDKIISIVLILWTTSCFCLPAKCENWEAIDSRKFTQTNLRNEQKAIDHGDGWKRHVCGAIKRTSRYCCKAERCFRSELWAMRGYGL